MPDVPALLQPLKDRLEPALFHAPYRAEGRKVVQANHHPKLGAYVLSSESMPVIAEFIAAAPTDQAKLIAAVERVAGLHQEGLAYCNECDQKWPCETITALTQALGGDTA